MSTPPSSDSEPLRSTFSDDPEMRELVEFFVGEMSDRVAAIEAALAGERADELQMLAHRLKGAAGGYGFPSITEEAGRLEQATTAAEIDLSAVAERAEALITLCRRASA